MEYKKLSSDRLNVEQKSNMLKLSSACNKIEKSDSLCNSSKNSQSIVTSLLDPYCKTSNLDESSDFIECDFRSRVKSEIKKNEVLCEICTENIAHLDVCNREMHVNNCMDKQISCGAPEMKSKTSKTENVFLLECPLCFKHFSSTELRASHIKKCGKSKGLSLQSIIKALELQERHTLERISLGLPAKPVKPMKSQKNPVPKRAIMEPKSKDHSDIQLAKALSLSLTTSVQQEVESSLVAPLALKPPTAQQKPGKKNKTAASSTPLLVLRSEEERKRLLLDRIATIIAPMNSSEKEDCFTAETPVSPKQQDSSTSIDELPTLWHMSGKASETDNYYVGELMDWIKPSDMEVGAKLCHLSQIPGHEIVTQLPCEYTFSVPEDKDKNSLDSAVSSTSVIECLQSLVASSWMSDVDICTACGTVIPAHKLLLAARCPPLKRDPHFCTGSERAMLKWETVSFDAALQFLNFIYTGNIEVKKDMVPDVSYLAKKYEVSDLTTYVSQYTFSQCDTENLNSPSVMKSDSNISLNINDATVPSDQSEEMELMQGSQEETNMDLDIVYNCINSSLKPSQLSDTDSKSFHSKIENSPSCSVNLDLAENSKISSGENYDSHPIQKRISPDFLLTECPTSPVIFDVDDSSSDEHQTPLTCSQKLSPRKSGGDADELNACDSESGSSQDSVKFLKSSFTSFNSSSKSCEKLENVILSPTPVREQRGCLLKESPAKVDDLLIDSPVPRGLTKFHINSKLEHSYSPVMPDFSDEEKFHILGSTITSDEHELDKTIFKSENILEIDTTNMASPAKTKDGTNINPVFAAFSKHEKSETSAKSELGENDVFLSPKSYSWIDHTSPLRNASSPEILITDSDSNSSFSHKAHSSDNYKIDNKQFAESKFSILNNTAISDEHELDKMILKNENAFKMDEFLSPAKTEDGQSNSSRIFDALAGHDKSETAATTELGKQNVQMSPESCSFVDYTSPLRNTASRKVLFSDSDSNPSFLHETQSPRNYKIDTKHSNSLSKSVSPRFSFLDFQKGEDTHKGESDYSAGLVERTLADSNHCKSNISAGTEITRCSSDAETSSPPLNGPLFHLPRENRVGKAAACHAQQREEMVPGMKNSCTASVSPEPFDDPPDETYEHDFTFHENSEVTPKSTRMIQKNITPFSKSGPPFVLTDSPITPFPDYNNMVTPEIVQALGRIGLKPLRRKKAVAFLTHVYDELHPIVNKETKEVSCTQISPQKNSKGKVTQSKKRKIPSEPKKKPSKKRQKEIPSQDIFRESDDSGSENPEWAGCVPEMSFSQFKEGSPTKINKDDIESIKQYIQSNEELYSHILSYKPLNMVEFHQELKNNGMRVSIQKLMDFLDEQCITFTCPRKEEYRQKQTARTQRFRKNMIAKLSSQQVR